MNTPLFISWRYQRSRSQNSLVSLISAFSTIGIALGVTVLIIGLSAMNGFQRELNQRILAVVPHLNISAYSTDGLRPALNNWKYLVQQVEKNNSIYVKGVSPFVNFTALIEHSNKMKVVQVQGVNRVDEDKVSALGQFVLNKRWENFSKDSGIILGSAIAQELGVREGDWISILVSEKQKNSLGSRPQRFRVQVEGILRLDGQLDYSYALLPLSQAQQFTGLRADQVTGVEFSLKNPFDVNKLNFNDLRDYPQQLTVHSWIEQFGYMYRDIQMIRSIMYIAMILVIGIACFNIISTLIMAVKDKQGDIAIMRTLGANNRFIKRIFLYYGMLSGMKGCVIGLFFGILISLNLTELVNGLEFLFHTHLLSEGVYFVDFLPSELHFSDVGLVFVVAMILSLLASLYPASRAVKLDPARILSFK